MLEEEEEEMMTIPIPTLPQSLIVILPLIVTAIAGFLGKDTLPAWLNAIIVAIVIAGLSVAAVIMSGAALSPNPLTDFMIFAGYCTALIASPILKPLLEKLFATTPSPFSFLAKASPPPPPVLTPRASSVGSQAQRPGGWQSVNALRQPPGDATPGPRPPEQGG